MTVEEATYAALSAAGAVTALVPASRIKVRGNWQNLAAPYIIHFPVSADPIHTHEGRAALTGWPFYQVSIFATTYSQARAIAQAVVTALGAVGHPKYFWRSQRALEDPNVNLQHIAVEFDISESL